MERDQLTASDKSQQVRRPNLGPMQMTVREKMKRPSPSMMDCLNIQPTRPKKITIES